MSPTAGQSILRELVPEAELMSAVSLYSIGFNFARIVGPSVGGCLVLCGVLVVIGAGIARHTHGELLDEE